MSKNVNRDAIMIFGIIGPKFLFIMGPQNFYLLNICGFNSQKSSNGFSAPECGEGYDQKVWFVILFLVVSW